MTGTSCGLHMLPLITQSHKSKGRFCSKIRLSMLFALHYNLFEFDVHKVAQTVVSLESTVVC
jgi:hypothetical protein